jgi:hypothetical protein
MFDQDPIRVENDARSRHRRMTGFAATATENEPATAINERWTGRYDIAKSSASRIGHASPEGRIDSRNTR